MKKNRRKYTQEFKEEAVKLITEQGYQITEAARNLGVNENMLGRWKREIEGAGEGALKKKALNQRFWSRKYALKEAPRCVVWVADPE